MAVAFRPPRQWQLAEKDVSITDFANWQSNLKYYLSLNNEYAAFIDPRFTWQRSSTLNRGLNPDGADVAQGERKSAAQKAIILEQMLGIIAQYSPPLIRSDIVKKSTSLNWIWQRIRRHFMFTRSEVNFLSIYKIKRVDGERYETLYQRLVAHLEDNLLTIDGDIVHDGVRVTANEELSPSCERLLVYLWLTLIDERLPAYISRIYAHDLQTRSLKDVQPQICQSLDSLLAELNTQDDSQVNFNRSHQKNSKSVRFKPKKKGSSLKKECILCKSAGRTYEGHDIGSCWFISKFDRLEMSRTLQVSVQDTDDDEGEQVEGESSEECYEVNTAPDDANEAVARRVSCSQSPFIHAFYKHVPCKILVDTGATSSMISADFVCRANLKVYTTGQGARQLDQSKVNVKGECKFYVTFGTLQLKIDALVTDCMDYDILGGCPFGIANDVVVLMKKQVISIMGKCFPYGAKPPAPPVHDIRRVDSLVLRNDTSRVLYPGEFVEVSSESLDEYEGEVSIEPRVDSPLQGTWPSPTISRVIQGSIRIPNETDEPIQTLCANSPSHISHGRTFQRL